MFGFSKLDVMFGRQTPDAVKHYYRDIAKPSVTFRQETVTAIDPVNRTVTTDRDHLRDRHPRRRARRRPRARAHARTGRGRQRVLHGRRRGTAPRRHPDLRARRRDRRRARAVLQVSGRAVRVRHDAAPVARRPRRARRDDDQGHDADGDARSRSRRRRRRGSSDALEERGIEFLAQTVVTSLDPATHQATLRDGELGRLRPVPRRPGAPRARGRRGVGARRRRLDPRRPHHLRDALPERVRRRRRHERAGAARRRDRRGRGGHRRRRARAPAARRRRPRRVPGESRRATSSSADPRSRGSTSTSSAGRARSRIFAEPSVEQAVAKKEFGSSRRRRWFGRP